MNLFLLYSLFSALHPDPPFHLCDTANLADDSPYRASLDNLLSSMPSDRPPNSKFYTTSNGSDSDRVYGRFMCYANSSQDECQKCLQPSLSRTIHKLCPYKYEAVVWENDCLFRYSTQNFSGQLNVTGNILLDNAQNISDPERLRSVANETLHDLSDLAAFDPSFDKHANGSAPFMGKNSYLHAFVECSRDLSPSDCSACLETAIKEILECCYFSRGARVLSRSCFLRYEAYEFLPDDSQTNQNSTTGSAKKIEKWMIAVMASGSGVVALSALGCCVFCLVVQRNRTSSNVVSGEDSKLEVSRENLGFMDNLDPREFPLIEMKIIEEATDNFADLNKLGEGGFGPVFKGILPDGQQIAVKRLSINSEQGSEEFINEVLLIHKLQHVNLVKLLGFCVHHEEKLLIYEYMPNGSLDSFLCDSRKRAQLNWSTRLNIITGVSRGMLYLHQDSRLKIIHRDLKPSNILLDGHMNPKISDFGMARIFGGNDGEANTAKIVGTFGYMAPEFAMEGLYSIKSDVFSYGVLLLEIITGKRNAGFHRTKLGPSLVAYAWRLWNEGKVQELMDPLLADSNAEEEFSRCMQIGLLCVQEDAQDRPSMSSVVQMLNRDTIALSQPKRPASIVGKFSDHNETCFNNLSMNKMTMSDLLPR